jgi:hypothetical protein
MDAAERDDVIAYLVTLTAPAAVPADASIPR